MERKSRLKKAQKKKLIELFVAGVTARGAAELAGVNRNTATKWFKMLREIITKKLEAETHFTGEIEIDESYFGGVRKGKRGRGAAGKVPVLGLLKRGGKVYTHVIENTQAKTLMPIITSVVQPDSIIYTDTYKSYNALDVTKFQHRRINHSKLFAKKRNHINGIENFWNQAKRNLRKFNGIPKKHFKLFIKECEWRFNFGSPLHLLKTLTGWLKSEL
jgi:transposase